MTLAAFVIGLFLGLALTATIAFFGVLSMEGSFRENLSAAAREARARLTGRHRRGSGTSPARSLEADGKMRTLQEEVKIMQRLMDQARNERQTHAEVAAMAATQMKELRDMIAKREEAILAAQVQFREACDHTTTLREELATRSAELAATRRDLRDIETELSVVQSGAGLSSISEEIARLRLERDELAARLERLTRLLPADKALPTGARSA